MKLDTKALVRNLQIMYGFGVDKELKVYKEGKYLKETSNMAFKVATIKKEALNQYRRYGMDVQALGFNRGQTVETLQVEIAKALKEKNDMFQDIPDESIVFTDTFARLVDKKVSLSIQEVRHFTKRIGYNVVTNRPRLLSFDECGRNSLEKYDKSNFVLRPTTYPDVFRDLESLGVCPTDLKVYKPWIYAISKNVTLLQFKGFVDDLRDNYYQISASGISSQEYLMRRLDCVDKGYTHQKYWKQYANKKTKSFTSRVFTILESKDLSKLKEGNLRSFLSDTDYFNYYSQSESERRFLQEQVNILNKLSFEKTQDWVYSVALIQLLKWREHTKGYSQEFKYYAEKQMGITHAQVEEFATLMNVSQNAIYRTFMNLYILPEYNGYKYVDFDDLKMYNPEITETFIEQHIVDLLNGQELKNVV